MFANFAKLSASQSAKAAGEMFFSPAPISTAWSASQNANAEVSIVVTLSGKAIVPCNFVQ